MEHYFSSFLQIIIIIKCLKDFIMLEVQSQAKGASYI
jgi:hypothetical protein